MSCISAGMLVVLITGLMPWSPAPMAIWFDSLRAILLAAQAHTKPHGQTAGTQSAPCAGGTCLQAALQRCCEAAGKGNDPLPEVVANDNVRY